MLSSSDLSQNSAQIKRFNDSAVAQFMGIGAHQDDLEIMAADGIFKAMKGGTHFCGIVCTDGGGSARTGDYASYSDEQMKEVRCQEQLDAAEFGKYSSMAQLNFPSKLIKTHINQDLVQDLSSLIQEARPEVIYTHNLADKHQTHVAVAQHVVEAIRSIENSPVKKLYGCEVWRNLDWLPDEKKVVFDLSEYASEIGQLISYFKSQTVGGKRYDLATLGRLKANATFFDSHEVDQLELALYAMDLTPLILDKKLSTSEFILGFIDDFSRAVKSSLENIGV